MATIISGDSGGTAVTTSTQKILQVVHATTTTQVDSTSASFVDTGLTASITPSATSATTYKIQMKTSSGVVRAQYDDGDGEQVSNIVLMEIGA